MIDQDHFNLCQKNYAVLDWKIIKKTRVGHILTILLILTICGELYFFAHLTPLIQRQYGESTMKNL